jgi:DNA-binding transcriptional MerR regulator
MKQAQQQWLSAAECARRTRLTVRALRVYEERGLVAPKRTEKGWRLYGPAELARLNEILTLKELGLGLTRIAQLLVGRAVDLDAALAAQQDALQELREHAGRSLVLVAAARKQIAEGKQITVDQLIQIVKETRMADTSSTVAWRRYEQARPRTEVKIDHRAYADYAGHYRFESGVVTITHRDDRLYGQITGQPEFELFAESDTSFFLKVVPAQVTFTRNGDGRVDRLVIHQGGYDIEAVRIDQAEADTFNDAIRLRIQERAPHPEGDVLVRRLVQQHQAGQPDYDEMTPSLADAVREQLALATPMIAAKGELRAVRFKGVAEAGWDVYDLEFENGEMEMRFVLNVDGKLSGLFMRPVP